MTICPLAHLHIPGFLGADPDHFPGRCLGVEVEQNNVARVARADGTCGPQRVGLTFDDAPLPDSVLMTGTERTKRIIAALHDGGVEGAMFFAVSSRIDENSIERMRAYGAAAHYDAIACEWLGRSPKHLLLLHENDADTLFLGQGQVAALAAIAGADEAQLRHEGESTEVLRARFENTVVLKPGESL